MLLLTSLLLFCFQIANANSHEKVTVKLDQGMLEGEVHIGKNDFKTNVFLGIPYAKPPVGELRYKKTEKAEGWKGLKEARTWPPRCIQSWVLGDVLPKLDSDSEDCLYLNVITPHSKSQDFPNGYPVMVWIHGGGYSFGSSVEYGIKGITGLMVPRGVVFVSIHYRLSSFGYFSLGDGESKGNLGLWDQTAALRWVRGNIGVFGGDQTKITIFGESAGGGSAGLLTLSPHSNTLFDQAIMMSGSSRNPWAINPFPIKHSRLFAKVLGCEKRDSSQILSCLRTKSVQEIEVAEIQVHENLTGGVDILFNPILDGEFFPEPISELQKKAPVIPTIIGANEKDFGLFATPPTPQVQMTCTVPTDREIGLEFFEKALHFLVPNELVKNAEFVRRLARHHYVDSRGNPRNSTFLVQQFTEMVNDVMIFCPAVLEAEGRIREGHPVWLYMYSYFNPQAFPPEHKYKGAYHLMEVEYLFDAQLLNHFKHNDKDIHIQNMLADLWTNFAKYGDPTPKPVEGVKWEKLNPGKNLNYLNINTTPKMEKDYNRRGNAFWLSLLPDLQRIDLAHNSGPEKQDQKHGEL